MAKIHWQSRRALARRLIALRAAVRAAQHNDTAESWRAAARAMYAARAAYYDLLRRRDSGLAPCGAWRLSRIEARIWRAGHRHKLITVAA